MAEKLDAYERALRRRPRVVVSGSGSVGDDEITVSGSLRAEGDVEVSRVSVSGSAVFEGSLRAESVTASGSLTVAGGLEASSVVVSGSARIGGPLRARMLSASGSLKVDGPVEVEEQLKVSGSLEASGDVTCKGTARLSGSIAVEGLLRAGELRVDLGGVSEVEGDVEAEVVEVRDAGRRGRVGALWIPLRALGRRPGRLYARRVRGGRLYLENVVCDDVEGDVVEVGPGCEVRGTVKYRVSVRVHPDARLAGEPMKA